MDLCQAVRGEVKTPIRNGAKWIDQPWPVTGNLSGVVDALLSEMRRYSGQRGVQGLLLKVDLNDRQPTLTPIQEIVRIVK